MKITLKRDGHWTKVYCSESYKCAQDSDLCPYKLTRKIEQQFIEEELIVTTAYMAYNCENYIPLEQESFIWV
jgi:hypothetical protein